jgi:hypothetical protein
MDRSCSFVTLVVVSAWCSIDRGWEVELEDYWGFLYPQRDQAQWQFRLNGSFEDT